MNDNGAKAGRSGRVMVVTPCRIVCEETGEVQHVAARLPLDLVLRQMTARG